MQKEQKEVLSILMMRFGLNPYRAIPLVKDWFNRHPHKSWQDLKQYLVDNEIILKYNQLHDIYALEIQNLVQKMRGKSGLDIRDRWFHFKLYRKCFTGDNAVTWLMEHRNLTKFEAIDLGRLLVKRKIIHHVHDEHNFKNGFLFYRFYQDEITVQPKLTQFNPSFSLKLNFFK